ncbi:MAG: hypothetical protein Unbinned4409contig1002_39 [Prokaryotic dsDNA virus sp.]|nr:MAG: hypothetical protein Unbinned4409contig1002_39 [Prokaryotic dsDNA virus sp.]|tara:strand:+ start:12450 stop:13859 length:1410 start_codon:yes stop_codon:yes gene_type:complete
MAQSIEEAVEARLGVSIPDAGNIVTANDLNQYVQDAVAEVYKALQKQNATEELRLFLGSSSIENNVTTILCNTANPTVFQKNGHNFQSGDYIKLNKFTQNASLNSTIQQVEVANANDFTLHNITTGTAETSGGVAFKLEDFTDYTSNPITGLNVKFFDAGYVLVERSFTETNSTYSKNTGRENYYACREISVDNVHKALDPKSVEYATNRNPVYYRNPDNGSITVIPEPTVNNPVRVWGLRSYRNLLGTHTAITYPDYPDSYFTALNYFCTAQAAHAYTTKTAIELRAQVFATQSTVSRLADSPPNITYGLANTISASPPAFNKPTTSPDFTRLNAFLDDDDAEMSTAVVQKVSQELQQYASDVQNEVAEWTDQFQRWQQEVAFEIQNADGDVQALVANHQNEVARFQTNVQTYAQDITQEVQKFTNLIQKRASEYQSFQGIAAMYESKFQQFITTRMPAQRQGGKDAG